MKPNDSINQIDQIDQIDHHGHRPIDWTSLLISCLIAVFILLSGAFYFRHIEKTFADVV